MHVSEAGCSLEFEVMLMVMLFYCAFRVGQRIGSVGFLRTLWQSIKVYWEINIDEFLNA